MFEGRLSVIKNIALDAGIRFIDNIKSRPNPSKFPEPYCRDCCRYTSYCVVEDELWDKIVGDNPSDIVLCFHCMEKRLGRKIKIDDLEAVPCNKPYFLGKLM